MSASAVAPPGAPALRAQELVDLGELGADAGGFAAGGVGGGVQLAAGLAGGLGGGFAGGALGLGGLGLGGALGERLGGGLAAALQLDELAFQAHAVVLGELGQLGLQGGDAVGRAVVAGVGRGGFLERGDRARAAGDPVAEVARSRAGRRRAAS